MRYTGIVFYTEIGNYGPNQNPIFFKKIVSYRNYTIGTLAMTEGYFVACSVARVAETGFRSDIAFFDL